MMLSNRQIIMRLLVIVCAAIMSVGMEMNEFSLKGRILNTAGEPLEAAFAVVLEGRGDFFPDNTTVETSSDGTFRLSESGSQDCAGLRNGEAVVRFRKSGYKAVIFQHDIPSARTMNIEVVLAEENSNERSGWRIIVDEDE